MVQSDVNTLFLNQKQQFSLKQIIALEKLVHSMHDTEGMYEENNGEVNRSYISDSTFTTDS